MNRLHIESVTQDKGNPFLLTEVRYPLPRKHTFDADDHVLALDGLSRRFRRDEQKRHEQHREKDPVSANSHRSVTLTADQRWKSGPRPAFRRGSPPS